MSPEFLRRYYILRIISTPKAYGIDYNGYVPLEELQNALEEKRMEFADNKLYEKLVNHSQKTIKRDIKYIESYFDVEIKLRRNYGYYIEDFKQNKDLREIFDKTELFLLNEKSQAWKNYISTEKSSLNSIVDIARLVNAIDQNLLVYIVYDGWYEDNNFMQIEDYIQPLHIKESNRTWYLIAHNPKIGVYTFSLDARVKEFTISNKKVEKPVSFNAEEYYNNSIGILVQGLKAEKIVLEVINHHFKHLENRPLHHTQKVISYPEKQKSDSLDINKKELWGKIEITAEPNYELLMELLKANLWIKVVSPKNFVDFYVRHIDKMRSFYN